MQSQKYTTHLNGIISRIVRMNTTGKRTMILATIAQVFCHDAASSFVPNDGTNPSPPPPIPSNKNFADNTRNTVFSK